MEKTCIYTGDKKKMVRFKQGEIMKSRFFHSTEISRKLDIY